MRLNMAPWLAAVLVFGTAASDEKTAASEVEKLQETLRAAETGFAKTMADRDVKAFAGFISDEAIFLGRTELRGKKAVVEAWSAYFTEKDAPFSWKPETAVVLDSGTLGLTSGPVFDPQGTRVGTFNSTWRREADGAWKIVFDKGCPPCDAK